MRLLCRYVAVHKEDIQLCNVRICRYHTGELQLKRTSHIGKFWKHYTRDINRLSYYVYELYIVLPRINRHFKANGDFGSLTDEFSMHTIPYNENV